VQVRRVPCQVRWRRGVVQTRLLAPQANSTPLSLSTLGADSYRPQSFGMTGNYAWPRVRPSGEGRIDGGLSEAVDSGFRQNDKVNAT